jgi:hypothetical protein
MSVEYWRELNELTISCDNDGCEYEETYEPMERDVPGGFEDCIYQAKQDGWRIYKEDGEWHHECPCCQNKEREA